MKEFLPNPQRVQNRSDLWSVQQAATYLDISQKQIYRLIKSGELPAFRIGRDHQATRRAIRIRPADVDRLLTPVIREADDLRSFIAHAAS